jgi:hypothetical protein
MKLSPKQHVVLDNTLAWVGARAPFVVRSTADCGHPLWVPSDEDSEILFAYTDRGKRLQGWGPAHPLIAGWTAHYQDPWRTAWEWHADPSARFGDLLPPAAWAAEALGLLPDDRPGLWPGWERVLGDFLHDAARDAKAHGISRELLLARRLPAIMKFVRMWAQWCSGSVAGR